jgi:Xaa-Pro aminopeptidase
MAKEGLAMETGKPTFDTAKLDGLLDEAGIDAVLVTSKHNIQYLLGGYRYFFYSFMDAHGLSRYLPFLVYVRGDLGKAGYVGSPMERFEKDFGKFWMPETSFSNMTTAQYAASAVAHVKRVGGDRGRIGVELGFLPADAYKVLVDGLPDAEIVDATFPLELLRTVKSPAELDLLRTASEKVVESMQAVFAGFGPGATKNELIAALRTEEQKRGLLFEYCLCNIGTDLNRAPSDQVWKEGEVLCLDSGGNYGGYIGDLARMGYAGAPDGELQDLLGFIEEVQQAARKPIREGVAGKEIYLEPDALVAASPFRDKLEFVAHGMGIVSHEGPWLTDRCSVPYPAYHADRPLEAGMVLSIETTLHHPTRGFIKLEDTLAVTVDGWEAFGDAGRGWNLR